jgi:shikimate dehydrogenase
MKVFCILSDARAFRSKSPAMHSAVLRRLGIDGVYVPFMVEPERVGDAVRGLRALNLAGANVTIPHKEAVLPYLDALASEAEAVGAVNTIVPGPEGLTGHNTDVGGFKEALAAADFDAKGKNALVMGTGGAAKAMVFALKSLGTEKVFVAGRARERTSQVAGRFGAVPQPLDSLLGLPVPVHLLVNATPASNFRESPELAARLERLDVPVCELVVDLNYGRSENFWFELAARVGARFMDGMPMLVHQARLSFALWTGIDVDADMFMEALEESL